jgi:hypothetical protein
MLVQRNSRKRNAVSTKSGEPVAHSGPGLIGPTLPATADRTSEACVGLQQGANLRPAVYHQHKNGQGLGQSPMSAEGALPLPLHSLDTLQINRDRPEGLKRYCGRKTARGKSIAEVGKTRFCYVGCKCWGCSFCGPRKAKRYRICIAKKAEQHKLNTLITLTLDPKKLRGKESTKYINQVFADFRVYLRRELGYAPPYIRVLEYQKNGNAHLHILANLGRFVHQSWISKTWAALGGGRVVDIKRVDMHRVSHYLSKYLTKEMLLHAPKRARRVTASKGLKLFEKQPKTHEWTIEPLSIDRAFDVHRKVISKIETDQERRLIAFETLSDRFGERSGIGRERLIGIP